MVIIRRGVTSGLEGTYEALERREYKIMMDILEDGNTLLTRSRGRPTCTLEKGVEEDKTVMYRRVEDDKTMNIRMEEVNIIMNIRAEVDKGVEKNKINHH